MKKKSDKIDQHILHYFIDGRLEQDKISFRRVHVSADVRIDICGNKMHRIFLSLSETLHADDDRHE